LSEQLEQLEAVRTGQRLAYARELPVKAILELPVGHARKHAQLIC
jgi:hypothetical protein